MKTCIVVALLCFLRLASLSAQPVINAIDFLPQIGDTFYLNNISVGPVFVFASGPNDTFQLALFNPSYPDLVHFADPITTPLGNLFPLSQFCELYATWGSSRYLSLDSNFLYLQGGKPQASTYSYAVYDNPAALMHFPLAYGDSIQDTYDGIWTDTLTNDTINISGFTQGIADGYGTALLPHGFVLTDVLRYHLTDSFMYVIDTTTFVCTINNYIFIKEGIHYPIAQLKSNVNYEFYISGGMGPITGGYHQDFLDTTFYAGVGTSISEHLTNSNMHHSLFVYPNPAQDKLLLSFTLSEDSRVSGWLTDIAGRQVMTIAKNSPFKTGKNEIEINCNDLTSGIYQCVVIENESHHYAKLVVQQ